jgi:hypothetical protein
MDGSQTSMSSNDNEVLVDSLIFQANEGISVNNQDPIENLYNAIRFAET